MNYFLKPERPGQWFTAGVWKDHYHPCGEHWRSATHHHVREICLYCTCWWYSLGTFQYRQQYENTGPYNFDCWMYTNLYFYIFIWCVNTRTSMITTNVFFSDFTDFQVRHTRWKFSRWIYVAILPRGQHKRKRECDACSVFDIVWPKWCLFQIQKTQWFLFIFSLFSFSLFTFHFSLFTFHFSF